jgi:streptomycin 6-kinase
VAPARTDDGDDVVLKVAWRHEESRDEAIGLSLLDGRAAVRVMLHDATSDTAALVLERCRPGTPLSTEPPAAQHREIAAILEEVRDTPVPTGTAVRPLTEMCDAWAGAAADRYRYTGVAIDRGMVAAGLELFRELPRTATTSTLLLTDLHAGNVLASTRRAWLAIDPKPYVGDPHYDVIQHLLNCAHLTVEPDRLVAEVARATCLERERIRDWLFARCVVEGGELLAVARSLAP